MRRVILASGGLAMLGLTLGWRPHACEAQGAAPPPNPTRAEVVQMMKDISNWGRWGASRRDRHLQPHHTGQAA